MFVLWGECTGGVGPGVPGVGGKELLSLLLYDVLRGGGLTMPILSFDECRGGKEGS